MRIEVHHVSFNPSQYAFGLTTLSAICSDQEKDGWQLVRLVNHSQWETIAVFERLVEE